MNNIEQQKQKVKDALAVVQAMVNCALENVGSENANRALTFVIPYANEARIENDRLLELMARAEVEL